MTLLGSFLSGVPLLFVTLYASAVSTAANRNGQTVDHTGFLPLLPGLQGFALSLLPQLLLKQMFDLTGKMNIGEGRILSFFFPI